MNERQHEYWMAAQHSQNSMSYTAQAEAKHEIDLIRCERSKEQAAIFRSVRSSNEARRRRLQDKVIMTGKVDGEMEKMGRNGCCYFNFRQTLDCKKRHLQIV